MTVQHAGNGGLRRLHTQFINMLLAAAVEAIRHDDFAVAVFGHFPLQHGVQILRIVGLRQNLAVLVLDAQRGIQRAANRLRPHRDGQFITLFRRDREDVLLPRLAEAAHDGGGHGHGLRFRHFRQRSRLVRDDEAIDMIRAAGEGNVRLGRV